MPKMLSTAVLAGLIVGVLTLLLCKYVLDMEPVDYTHIVGLAFAVGASIGAWFKRGE